MALDAAMLGIAADEIGQWLTGARVDRISMPARDTVLIAVRGEQGGRRLLLSARPGMSRVHFTAEEFDNPAVPPAFCMLLRKYLSSGRFREVRAAAGERVIFFVLDAMGDMGERREITVSVELMGRYSNIVLIDGENRVIDALKRITAEQSDRRQLLPGIEFRMPPKQDKLPFFETPPEKLSAAVSLDSKPLAAALLDAASGIGPVVCREIAFRVSRADLEADRLNEAERERLPAVIAAVQAAKEGVGRRLSIVYDRGRPVEFSFFPLTQYAASEFEYFDDVSSLLDRYYAERDRADLINTRSADLKRQLHTVIERAVRRQQSRREDMESTADAEQYRLLGELLTANLHHIQKGSAVAEVTNYYTGNRVAIPLDPQKSPSQNAQKYYRLYRKQTNAKRVLAELLRQGIDEIEYLESVRYAAELAGTEEEFANIRRELIAAGYLRAYRAPKGKPRKTEDFLRFRSSGGFSITAGKNNAANDKLALKTSQKTDIWFHVKGGAGSHVVLCCEGKAPPDEDKTEAAIIAAFHSALRNGDRVPVDFTEIRHIKKAPGAKPGMVTYQNYETAFVRPDGDLVDRLKAEK